MAEQQFHELTVAAVRPQTAHAKAIRFELPDALKAEFTFKPGQYLTLRTTLNGEEVRRSYSICCAPDEGIEIGVKHVKSIKDMGTLERLVAFLEGKPDSRPDQQGTVQIEIKDGPDREQLRKNLVKILANGDLRDGEEQNEET